MLIKLGAQLARGLLLLAIIPTLVVAQVGALMLVAAQGTPTTAPEALISPERRPYHEDHPILAYYYGMVGRAYDDPGKSVITRAQEAGIDGFIVRTSGSLGPMLRAAEGTDFRVSVHLHPSDSVGNFYQYIDHPNLVTYQGRPVLFTWQARLTDPAVWQQRREQYDPERRALWIADGDKFDILADDVWDGISPYAIAWSNAPAAHLSSWAARSRANGPGKLFIPPVSPGCDLPPQRIHDGRDPCVQDRRGGDYYRSTWEAALATRPPWAIVVSTWDEEAEGTGIQPTYDWGDTYLAVTREYSVRVNGESALVADLGASSRPD